MLKKIRNKLLRPVIEQLDDLHQNEFLSFNHINLKLEEIDSEQKQNMENFSNFSNYLLKEREAVKKKALQDLIAERWKTYDTVDDVRFSDYHFPCPICEQSIHTKTAKQYNSKCIFDGGNLKRFECPNCGTIIGPLKMLTLTPADFSRDYTQHYTIYAEGDTTEDEKFTFYNLNPSKEKRYLNYGCGGTWSRCIDELRAEGYQVYGYEPYANESNSPYIMTSIQDFHDMKFDGIFTNNVLEHLTDPIQTFLEMKVLLKDEHSLMNHSTPCYEYLFEYTRFHLFFFTKESINHLCKKTGLEAFDRYDTIRFQNQYSSMFFRQI